MSEEIIGIDKPAVGALAWLLDELRTTDAEDAANAVVELFEAVGASDGARACSVLTESSKREVETQESLLSGGEEPSCEEAIIQSFDRLGTVGGPSREDLEDIDPERIEDSIEVEGDRATLTAESELTATSIGLVRADGTWLVDLTASRATPRPSPGAEPSPEELLGAADGMCREGFSRSTSALGRFVQALNARRYSEAKRHAREWAASERELSADLRQLNADAQAAELEGLVAALEVEADEISRLANDPLRFVRARRPLRRSIEAVSEVAARGGFAAFGCAAPTGNTAAAP